MSMSSTRAALFESYFNALERKSIPYVILHSYDGFPSKFTSDIDYAVRDCDLASLPLIQAEVAKEHGWILAHTVQSRIFAIYSVLFSHDNPDDFLALDSCSHYVESRCFCVPCQVLLQNRTSFHGFFVPAPSAEFIYLMTRTLAKKKAVDEYLPRMRTLWSQDPLH